MNDEEIVSLVKRALAQVAPEHAERFERISMDSKVEDFDVDSIALVEMVGCIEDAIGRTFRPSQVVGVRSVKDIAALIRGEGTRETA